MTSHDPKQPGTPSSNSPCRDSMPLAWKCNPAIFLRDPAPDQEAVIACIRELEPDRENPLPLGPDFIRLIKLWGIIARPYKSGPYPRFDVSVLRRLLDGRVREAIAFLCRQNDPELQQALDKIEKMANFGADTGTGHAGLKGGRLFGWLRDQLTGTRRGEERVKICKAALEPLPVKEDNGALDRK